LATKIGNVKDVMLPSKGTLHLRLVTTLRSKDFGLQVRVFLKENKSKILHPLMKKICFATNNLNKIVEVQQLIGNQIALVSLEQIGCSIELPETKDTIPDNSAQKAEYVWENFGVACFADDSGLEVEALGGAPGVFSARYAGVPQNDMANIRLLLQNLTNQTNRKARFRTCITLVTKHGKWQFEGIVQGLITQELRGNNGFGYDPIFVPDGYEQTFAEMDIQQKNKISHRAIAVKKLVDFLQKKPNLL
jgi:XTP/dITP diphosphohydrolase